MLQQLISLNVFAFFLIFVRVGAAAMSFPGYSAGWVMPRIRLLLALSIAFIMTPIMMDQLPPMPSSTPVLVFLIISEAIIGLLFGLIGRVFIGSLQVAGTLIALMSSLSNAMVQDPVAEQQSSVISGFLMTTGLVLVFVTDLHHLMIVALVDSYTLFKPGGVLPVGDIANFMGRKVSDSFALGLQMSSPFIITSMIYYIGLGLLGRLMPALQVFFFGIPIQISMQIWVLTITVTGILLVFIQHFREGFGTFMIN